VFGVRRSEFGVRRSALNVQRRPGRVRDNSVQGLRVYPELTLPDSASPMSGQRVHAERRTLNAERSSVPAVKCRHFAIGFSFDRLLFEVVPFVDSRFSFSDTDFHFDPAVFPVKPERDNRLTLDRAEGKEFGNLRFVEQKFPATFWFVLAVTGTFVRLDICVVKVDFVILDSREGVIKVRKPGADRFDLRSLQFDTSLYLFENLIVMERTAIGCDLGGHKSLPLQVEGFSKPWRPVPAETRR
jgi:hypothetical protein